MTLRSTRAKIRMDRMAAALRAAARIIAQRRRASRKKRERVLKKIDAALD